MSCIRSIRIDGLLRDLDAEGAHIASFGRPDHRWTGPLAQFLKMFVLAPFVSQRMATFVSKPSQDDLVFFRELIEAGEVTPVIDRTYPLSETPEAVRYLEDGHVRGKVVITV